MTDLHRLFKVNSGNMLDLEHCRSPDVVDDCLPPNDSRIFFDSCALEANDAARHLLTLCQLTGGSSDQVDEAHEAKKALKAVGDIRPFQRRRVKELRRLRQSHRKPGDDDDPPPSPAYAVVPPKGGGGADLARSEAVAA